MRILPLSIIAVAAVAIIGGGYAYWRHGARYPSTDDAYVNANTVRIAPLVGGRVTQVYVRNQQHIAQGQPLFDIDPQPYELTLREAEARLAVSKQDAASGVGEVRATDAEVRNREALLANARSVAARNQSLVAQGFLSHQAADNTQAAVKSASAELSAAQAKATQARESLGKAGSQNEHVREAAATTEKAQLDLSHTHITAACNGNVAELSLHPGDTVNANTPLFALICDKEFWVDANFKETQLERIRPGQAVTITVDMYPKKHFPGRVENIGGATGSAFSLLPPQNATGNWVKVTQRVPVRVLVTQPDPNFPLRVGASAKVTVDTVVASDPSNSVKTGNTGVNAVPAGT